MTAEQPTRGSSQSTGPDEKPKDPVAPPDGGARAWTSVAGAFIFQFCSFGFVNALGTFQVEYEKYVLPGYSASSISWILTFQLFLMFFFSQFVGIAVDMFGPRALTIPGSILTVCGLISLSFARQYYSIFLAQGVCFGIGAAGIFMPGLIVAGQYFKERRALALGAAACGSSLGGVIFPILLAHLFPQIGFGPTLRWTALMIGVLLIAANLMMLPSQKPKGLAGARNLFRFSVFKNARYIIYVTGAFLFFWGLFAPFNFLPSFATKSPRTDYLALYTVSMINAASVLGRVLPSYFADRLGRLATMTVFSYVAAVSVLVIWLPINFYPSVAGLVIFTLVFGFASGSFVSLMTACLIDISGGQTHDLGAMLGMYMMIISFAALTGSPIQAAISSGSGDSLFLGLIIFSGVAMTVGSVLISIAWHQHNANNKRTEIRKAREEEEQKELANR